MIYWKGISHQLINLVVRSDDNVGKYTGGSVIPRIALNNNTISTGTGIVDKKEDGRFNYTMSADDCNGVSIGIMFENEGAELKEHYFRPIEPPVQDDFYGLGGALDAQKTALGNLDWTLDSANWYRSGYAHIPSDTGSGKRFAVVNLNSPNVFALQTYFTLPDVDFIRQGLILRQGATGADGIYCVVDTGEDGETDPTLKVIQGDDGDSVITENTLDPAIRGQVCILRAMAIGATINVMLYTNYGSAYFLTMNSGSTSHLTKTNHGLFADRYGGGDPDLDFSYMRLVPYLEG